MQNLFEKIDKLAREEIQKTGLPQMCNYEVANRAAEALAKAYGADVELAKCATALMDIKFGEAVGEGVQFKHVEMSAEYAEKILNDFGVDENTKKLLLNCVLAHHGAVPFESKEAEIAANADSYRFISETGVFISFEFALSLGKSFNEALDFVKFKLDEKFNILSLDIAQKQLTDKYYELSELVKKAKI